MILGQKKEHMKKYCEENIEKISERKRKYREKNKEQIRKYREKYREENKERISERERKYQEENKELIKERKRKHYEKNKKQISEYNKKHRERNKSRTKIYARNLRKETPWYIAYSGAKQRCTNPNGVRFKSYGGRGIKFYLTLQDFEHFWFRDNAEMMDRPSIDRINSNGNYEFNNCRFLEMSENSRRARKNRRTTWQNL